MKKLLITGATGILGNEIIKKAHLKYQLFGTYNQTKNLENDPKCNYLKLEISNKKAVENCINSIKPNYIIHCAAITNVDECEKEKILANETNIKGTLYLAEKSDKEKIKFIYISTDYVFSGRKNECKEDDERIPTCVYGLTKLEGEKIIEKLEESIIARVTVPYTWKKLTTKNNFANWLIDKNKKGKEVKIVVDQYNNPTYVPNAAENILKLIEMDTKGKFNITGKDCLSRYEFAIKIAKVFDLDKRLIIPCLTSELNQAAIRPVYVNTNTEKAQKAGLEILMVEDGLRRMKGDLIGR